MGDPILDELSCMRLGRTLKGKWTLDEVLGVGGSAAVYGATHRNGARVAIKMLHAQVSVSAEARRRFVREGYLANKVEHPAIVRILDDDVDDHDGSAFLVMERAVGTSLCDRAERALLDEVEALEVAEQVLDALVVAHRNGIVHRDLKPDNLLVDEEGTIRLLDFGIARDLCDDFSATSTGMTFGTPGYMAPEQAMGRKHQISPRTDLYALGATLFTLLCGEFVQEAGNSQELLIRIATRPARSLGEVKPSASIDMITLVDRATMMDPEDRWPSAEAMLDRVRLMKEARGLSPADGAQRRKISSRLPRVIVEEPKVTYAEPIAEVAMSSEELRVSRAPTRPSLAKAKGKAPRLHRARTPMLIAAATIAAAIAFTISYGRPHVTAAQANLPPEAPTAIEATPQPTSAPTITLASRVEEPAVIEVAKPATKSTATPAATAKPARQKAAPKRPRSIDVGY